MISFELSLVKLLRYIFLVNADHVLSDGFFLKGVRIRQLFDG